MKLRPKQILMRSLMFTALGAAGLVVIDQTTHWPPNVKLIWPIGWLAIAFLNAIFCLYRNAHADDTPKPSASSAESSWPTTPTVSSSIKLAPSKRMETAFYIAGPIFVLIALAMGVPMLFKMLNASNQSFIQNSRHVEVKNPLSISSGCVSKVDIDKFLIADPGKIYDVFELKSGQHWRLYAPREFEYRIKVTGQEPFMQMPRLPNYQQELVADRAGMLQVRTDYKNHEIHPERLIPCNIK